MLINDARRDARFVEGEVVLLRDQDRSLWDVDQIAAGRGELDRAIALGGRGTYVLQAAIASCAPTIRRTGRRSPRSTASWAASPGRRSWSSTAPLPSPRRATRRARWQLVESIELDDYHYLTQPGPNCCAGSTTPRRRARRTSAPWSSFTPTPSDVSSNDVGRSSDIQMRDNANTCCP